MKKNWLTLSLVPIFFGFFVMGFVDVVGIATSYVKADFAAQLPAEYFGFIPSFALLWFLIFSVPSAILMNKIGRKNTVFLSVAITAAGMTIPFACYNLYTCLAGFAFLGIGNTIIQVSLNPLLRNIVSAEKLASAMTAGQAIKAVSSFAGPFIALFAAATLGNWQYIFPIFGAITIIFGITLYLDKIPRENAEKSASVLKTFSLLQNKTILLLFIGIIAVVGIDVGMNMGSSMLLMERLNLDPNLDASVKKVALVPSLYFACRTIGAFAGTAILARMDASKYFKIHMAISLAAILAMSVAANEILILTLVGITGYGISSIFSVIYSLALNSKPDSENEISGLLMTAIFGGAITPPLMTFAAKFAGSQTAAILVLAAAALYLLICAYTVKVKNI